MPVIWFYNSN